MIRRQLGPLRPLTEPEQTGLTQLSPSLHAPAGQVARAKALLAVTGGASYTGAACLAGRRSGDTISQLAVRFNWEGLAAILLQKLVTEGEGRGRWRLSQLRLPLQTGWR
jgi:hypothetical protein